MKIVFGDGIFACNPRDFGIFMPKHLAEYYLLNSYKELLYFYIQYNMFSSTFKYFHLP